MLAFRPIALLFALLALSSCAYGPDKSVFAGGQCNTYSVEHLQGVDWQQATKLNLRIRQDDFFPIYMALHQNKSYVLKIENADDVGHTFRAMEFFRAVAVAGVRVEGEGFEQVSCLKGLSIPAGKVTEVRFVAIRDGTYEFEDNALMFSLAMIGSAGGFITIEPPRVLSVSPLEHLKLFERKPIQLTPEETRPTGLFDDEEEEPTQEPGSLFDDEEPAPDEPPSGLFDDSAPVEPAPDIFSEPSPEILPQPPEAPVVETPVETPPEETVVEPLESEPDMMLEDPPLVESVPEQPEGEIFEGEEEFFVEEEIAPDDAAPPQPQAPLALPDPYDALEGPPADIFSDPPDVVNSGPGSGGAAGDDQFDG